MRVKIRLFARLRDLAGAAELEREVPAGATIGDVWRALADEFPALHAYEATVSSARKDDYARRTTPVAVGIKLANPELILIAYMGDGGGYAIGAQHLVAAAQRNDRITVILINNTQYGMTGGQMAPTTLPGQKTETSPYGRNPAETGHPMKGPEMVAALTGEQSYCARGTVSKPQQLKIFLKRALENQLAGRGFSFVEVLSTCPTNWRTGPEETWRFLEEEVAGYYRVGEIKVPPGPDKGPENIAPAGAGREGV
ncbi:MAG: MoaD/ThiS family protein [Peptococcaceae bacterium]|nr:MoaD/ThiS family protein [Peptococcaceae bacterium]